MMRVLFVLVLTLLTVSGGQAQTVPEPSTSAGVPDTVSVLRWLYSPDPRLQAWAAHNILVYRLTDLIPDLQSLLDRTTPATLSDAARLANFRTTLAILDTLIELGSSVPATTLARIEKLGYDAQPEELILLSRLPWSEAESAAFSLYRSDSSSSPDVTRVAAQLLARHQTKGFAAELLSTILVSIHISVHDANGGTSGGTGSGSSFCCGGSGPDTSDWPETGRYSFQDSPQSPQKLAENETLFLSAPDPIYLVRTVSRKYYPTTCGGFSSLNDAIRSHLVGTLLNEDPSSPFPEGPVALSILFKSSESYRAEAQSLVDTYLDNFNRVTTALAVSGALTEEERQAATLRSQLSVQDLRIQPAEDLPELDFRSPIQWVTAFLSVVKFTGNAESDSRWKLFSNSLRFRD